MKTRTEIGELISPARLLEMLECRFGTFKVIAHAASTLADSDPDFRPPMDKRTASAILEFGRDLEQAYEASLEWMVAHGFGAPPDQAEGSERAAAGPPAHGATTSG